ncbi:hypothetical protein GCM10025771_01490 [Niveibacterium umoris]|uniref:Anti-anti-sigma factor n=1 Tax=Niveibacterium umoris TaxID=1193620 RepID=A0A840BS15_9RHOO|nr:STAS domain-containing protein [Niveibacterium umoris]MBB4014308.1 anti-anti-sigma factor [Niveibacterium umoris]
MPVSEKTRDGGKVLCINGGMTIFEAVELREQLSAALTAAPERLAVDLSGVEEIDTAGTQLLIALKRQAAKEGKALEYCLHSAAVLGVIDLLNLAGALGDPVLVASAG